MDCRTSLNTSKKKQGVTLIELLVSGVLLSLSAGVVYTIFHIYSKEADDILVSTKLKTQADILLTFIGDHMRTSDNVRGGNDDFNTASAYQEINDSTGNLRFYRDNTMAETMQYDITTDTFRILDPAIGHWENFTIANDMVTVEPFPQSAFSLAGGNQMSVRLILTTMYKGHNYTLTLPKSHFRCKQ